ncbi:MAG: cyclic nucleotide-binding domain-containing protein [Leptolyngbya sp. SIO1D8]|nr:cyclic nucleotide-binding domain-containing protein [Leptolyngbya sp. SIO1D8]
MTAARTIQLFSKVPNNLEFKAGEIIFQAGDIGTVMYGLMEGSVEFQVDGKVVEIIESGDVFGEGALVQPNATRASTAIAKTDCKLAVLDEERFKFLIENTPMFALDVMRSYSNRLRHFKQSQ